MMNLFLSKGEQIDVFKFEFIFVKMIISLIMISMIEYQCYPCR